jgi:tetratricopeptide (TPR) repeat protein
VDRDCEQYSLVKRAVCVLLLSASKFHDNAWKQDSIRRVNALLMNECDSYLKAWAVHRESSILRLRGEVAGSYRALEECLHSKIFDKELDSDARWNAQQGDLVISLSENLMRDNDLARAKSELQAWQPLNIEAPSTMERMVLQSRNVMLGRLLKNQGRFNEALPYFQRLFKELSFRDYNVSTGWQMVMFSNLADCYCEVGRPDDAEAVLEAELGIIYESGWENISNGRRLQLALIETFIRRGFFKQAEECLLKLIPMFEAIAEPDILQNTGHFRVWAGLARISHLEGNWDDALVRWNRALGIVEAAGWNKGCTHGIFLYSIAQALFRIGDLDASLVTLENAKKSLAAEDRKYWIVGLGSYWYDYVVLPLGETGPNPIVIQPKNIRANAQDRLIDQLFGPWEPNTRRLPNGGDGTASIAMGTGQRKAIEASSS